MGEARFAADAPLDLLLEPSTSQGAANGFESFAFWLGRCHGWWYNAALIIPSTAFVAFLIIQARSSISKLCHGYSRLMTSYYCLIWLASVLNLAWCFLQFWQCTPGKELAWNLLSLLATSGMLFLEISLVAFLVQGNNQSNGLESLTQTFVISNIIVGADAFLKSIYIFAMGIPLFSDTSDNAGSVKWGLWVAHRLLLTGLYGFILFMYHTRWQERLPARPAFRNYIMVMFLVNASALLSCMLVGSGAVFGLWIHNFVAVCYHALYIPFLYATFLAEFLQEDDVNLENVYYSEMKDAGFFDAD